MDMSTSYFVHRFAAAFRAIAARFSGVSTFARAAPPSFPSCAAGLGAGASSSRSSGSSPVAIRITFTAPRSRRWGASRLWGLGASGEPSHTVLAHSLVPELGEFALHVDNIALEGRKVMLKVERLLANIAAVKNSK